MNQPPFNYQSVRAQKARFARSVTTPAARFTLAILASGFVLGGLVLIGTGIAAGWLLLIPATPCIMLLAWSNGELNDIPPDPKSQGLDGIIASDLLGRLPREYTVHDLVMMALKTREGLFLANRFGLYDVFFEALLEQGQVSVVL